MQQAAFLWKSAIWLAFDQNLARVLSSEFSLEEEHVDDGEEEDVDDDKQQVARIVLNTGRRMSYLVYMNPKYQIQCMHRTVIIRFSP